MRGCVSKWTCQNLLKRVLRLMIAVMWWCMRIFLRCVIRMVGPSTLLQFAQMLGKKRTMGMQRHDTDSHQNDEPHESISSPVDSNLRTQGEDEYGPWLLMKRKGKKKQNASQHTSQSVKEDNSVRDHNLPSKRHDSRIPLKEMPKQVPRRALSTKNKQSVSGNRFASLGNIDKDNFQNVNIDNTYNVYDYFDTSKSARHTMHGPSRDELNKGLNYTLASRFRGGELNT